MLMGSNVLRLVAVALTSILLAAVTRNPRIRSVPYPGHVFAIQVATNKQTYRLGEPIEVRVSITNLTDQPYAIYYIPAWALSGLKVVDSRGEQIAVTKPQIIGRGDPRNRYNFAPRETISLGQIDIGQFGYNLTEPGSYIISASLHGAGFRNTPDGSLDKFGLSGEEKASPVRIEILK
jgi:hypothetical protein